MRIPTRRPPPGPGRPAPAQRRRSGRCAAWTGAEPAARPAGGRGARSALALRPALSARAAPERFPQGDGLPPPRPLRLGRGPLPLQQRLKSHRHESPSRQVPPPPAEPPQGRQVSGAGRGLTSGPASPAGAAGAVLQAAPRLGAVLGAGGGGRRPMGGAGRRAGLAPGCGLRPCPAGPPREVSGRRPPGASRRLPPDRAPPRGTPGAAGAAGAAALTGLAARRRRVCVCGAGRRRAGDTHWAGRGRRAGPAAAAARGDRTERRGPGRWDAGAQLRCGRTAVAPGNAGRAGRGGGARRRAGARAPAGVRGQARGGVPRTRLGLGGGRAGRRGAGAGAGGRGAGRRCACVRRALPGARRPGACARALGPEASGRAARGARRRTCEVSPEERAVGARSRARVPPPLARREFPGPGCGPSVCPGPGRGAGRPWGRGRGRGGPAAERVKERPAARTRDGPRAGPAPGPRPEGPSRPGGPGAGPAEGSGVSGLRVRRGPRRRAARSGVPRWRPGARRRLGSGRARPRGSRTPEPPPLLWRPREGGAEPPRGPRRGALEPFPAGPGRGGRGRGRGAGGGGASLQGALWFCRAGGPEPDERPAQVTRSPARSGRRGTPPFHCLTGPAGPPQVKRRQRGEGGPPSFGTWGSVPSLLLMNSVRPPPRHPLPPPRSGLTCPHLCQVTSRPPPPKLGPLGEPSLRGSAGRALA